MGTPDRRLGRGRRAHSRRWYVFALGGGMLLGLAAAAGFLLSVRYLPAVDEAGRLRTDIEAMTASVKAASIDIDRPTVQGLGRDLASARERLGRLEDLLSNDPLIGLARLLPPTQPNVTGADTIVRATRDLFVAADEMRAVATRFIDIRERQSADPGSASTLSALVELMATSRDHALAAQAALGRARVDLATVPVGLAAPVESARSAIVKRIDTYGPLLDSYVAVSERLPLALGWETPKRYLILTQDPAELRPTGGYTGSYGVITFDRGRMTERTFRDIALLDSPWDFPFVGPPTELANYLLGPGQPWQLADANWSPDFPTSARDAVRLYTNESADNRIDGVLAITTYTIDELLKVTGPIAVPEYDTTLASGETTLKVLQLTRVAKPGDERKAFLSTFADHLFASLLGLPPRGWADLLGRVDTFRTQHLLLAWFKEPKDEALAIRSGLDGRVRDDPGDYLYPVDSNVAPASKINAITTRSLHLDVALDSLGDARNTLDITWNNAIDTALGKPYRELPTHERLRILGMYFRLLAPVGSRVESVSGGSLVKLTAPALVSEEAGRAVIGTYLMVPPGVTDLRYVWSSRHVADIDESGGDYNLTIQKQPGLRDGPLTLTIRVPPNYRIESATHGLQISGGTATLTMPFNQDLSLSIRFVSLGPTDPAGRSGTSVGLYSATVVRGKHGT